MCCSDDPPQHLDAYPPILTDIHIMELYGLANRRAAQKFIKKHGIPHQRLGRQYSILRDDFFEWLRDRTETGVDDDLIDDMFDEIVGRDDDEDDADEDDR